VSHAPPLQSQHPSSAGAKRLRAIQLITTINGVDGIMNSHMQDRKNARLRERIDLRRNSRVRRDAVPARDIVGGNRYGRHQQQDAAELNHFAYHTFAPFVVNVSEAELALVESSIVSYVILCKFGFTGYL
jgi:hypothetical protein